jgi:hypothetical protein
MKTEFKTPAWMKEWQAKYAPILVEGLTDGPTYVKLGAKSLDALDVVLAFRPMISRIDKGTIVVGGKLSVFPVKDSIKAQPSSTNVMVKWLEGAYPNAEFPKKGKERVGTIIASLQKAPLDGGKAYTAQFRESDNVSKMMSYIEALTGEAIDGRKLAERAIQEAFVAEMPDVFTKIDDPDAVVSSAGVYGDGDNVVKLIAKKQIDAVLATLGETEGSETTH